MKRVSKVNPRRVLSLSVRRKAQDGGLPTEQAPQLAPERLCTGSLSVQMHRKEKEHFFVVVISIDKKI